MHPTLPSPRRFQRSASGLGRWRIHPQEISLGSLLGHLDGIHFFIIFRCPFGSIFYRFSSPIWCQLGLQNRAKSIKNRCKNRSKNRCLSRSTFGAILVHFGRENGAKLTPKWGQKSIKNRSKEALKNKWQKEDD